jgi:hypothetical protein
MKRHARGFACQPRGRTGGLGKHLLRTGTLVSFRIVSDEVLNALVDEAEFGLRLQLKFVTLWLQWTFYSLDQLVIELSRPR